MQKKPMMVVQINDVKVVSVGTAGSTVLVTDSTGVLRGWGRNEDGQVSNPANKLLFERVLLHVGPVSQANVKSALVQYLMFAGIS